MTEVNCPNQDKLVCMATGDLNPEETDVLVSHVSNCSACRQELEALQATLTALPDNTVLPTRSEVSAFTDRVLTATSKRQRLFIWEGVATIATIGLIAFFVFKPGTVTVPQGIDTPIANELAVLSDFDLIVNLELLQDLELLELLEDRG